MGYGINMTNSDGTPCMVHSDNVGGGIIRLYEGKTPNMVEAETSITYNYGKYYYDTIDKKDGIRWIYGKTGDEVKDKLLEAISTSGTKFSGDYWEDTPGNAGVMLEMLFKWCVENPKGIFRGD